MENTSHDEPVGNTSTTGSTPAKTGKKPPQYQLYRWVFTLKADESQESQLSQSRNIWHMLNSICKSFKFQLERGEGGYEHFQGVMSLRVKHRMNEVKNMLGWDTVHLEPCKQWFASLNYCGKPEGRIAGPWTERVKVIEPKIKGDLFPWQEELVTYLDSQPDDRKIRIYQDPIGNNGKSTFGIHLHRTRSDVLYIPSGKFEGVKEHIVRAINEGGIRAVIFDIPRDKGDWVPKALMEELKNGFVLNTRYSTETYDGEPLHVILFTNQVLSTYVWGESFSMDRLEIINLS